MNILICRVLDLLNIYNKPNKYDYEKTNITDFDDDDGPGMECQGAGFDSRDS